MTEMTEKEESRLIELLKKVKSPMSAELYNAFAGIFPQIPIEVVIIRMNEKGNPEALLLRRSSEDKFWPNLWHSPGTILRNMETLETALKRLEVQEIGILFVRSLEFVTWWNNIENKRGHEVAIIYRYFVEKGFEPRSGKFFPINELPRDIIPHHRDIIGIVEESLGKKPCSSYSYFRIIG